MEASFFTRICVRKSLGMGAKFNNNGHEGEQNIVLSIEFGGTAYNKYTHIVLRYSQNSLFLKNFYMTKKS